MSRIRIVETIGSTNAVLLDDRAAVEGDWLVALRQDQGRGRQGRAWQTVEGNFFGSTLIALRPGDPPAHSLALIAGLALVDAIDVIAPGSALSLKWPNDVILDGAKLAGILLERHGDRVVAGFGVNLAGSPAITDRKTASLEGLITPQAFAPILAGQFGRLLGAWRVAEPAATARAWLARAHPIGTPLRVHGNHGEPIEGFFEGIERDGALRLRRDDGQTDIVHAGDVELG